MQHSFASVHACHIRIKDITQASKHFTEPQPLFLAPPFFWSAVINSAIFLVLWLCVLPLQVSNNSDDNYAQVLGYSYLFYEAQQSGVLPSWNRLLYGTSSQYGVGYRKSAHVTDSVNGVSLMGGWYDAGGEPYQDPIDRLTRSSKLHAMGQLITAQHLSKHDVQYDAGQQHVCVHSSSLLHLGYAMITACNESGTDLVVLTSQGHYTRLTFVRADT